ncbi:MAG: RNase adapter RapZ [Acidobacteria bacterium]|nr:RNase adapter RapZ [Acidobacteriota bacterium]MBI3656585.1 RNase adapter RapZ [Acidobacteriota bacterium]
MKNERAINRQVPARDWPKSTELKDLIIVTGLSGSGKRSAIKAFEDLGYFCIDNLPVRLIPKLLDLSTVSGGELNRLALVIDIREGEFLTEFKDFYEKLHRKNFRVQIMFFEASDAALVTRFRETRRPHPLAIDTPILEGIAQERERLKQIRALADMVIDTSDLTVHTLKKYVLDHFRRPGQGGGIVVTITSFGFKYGIPFESDLMFDVRFLPNPNFVRQLKSKNGTNQGIVKYMRSFPETEEVIRRIGDFLGYLIPKYLREGKAYLNISVGCTGGRHRSVMVSEAIRDFLKKPGQDVEVVHRDLDKN